MFRSSTCFEHVGARGVLKGLRRNIRGNTMYAMHLEVSETRRDVAHLMIPCGCLGQEATMYPALYHTPSLLWRI